MALEMRNIKITVEGLDELKHLVEALDLKLKEVKELTDAIEANEIIVQIRKS